MKKRRKARELALQALYAFEMGAGDDCLKILEDVAETRQYGPVVREYARALVEKAQEGREEADALIRKHAANWRLERMAAIDRNLLRMAVTELRCFEETPPKVVMDEAVELAKIYSTEESSRFVNGIIDSIYKELVAKKV